MWIGTTGKGFSVCQSGQTYDQLEFRHYDEDDGLVNNVVQSIVEDRDGKIWLGTEYGMSRFDPDTEVFDSFFFQR